MPKINKGERNKRGSGTRMKREYVKPVIESEEFVANEYVAACYVVTCTETIIGTTGHGTDVVFLDSAPTESDQDDDGFYRGYLSWWYKGTINGHQGSPVPHPVKWVSGENGGAASVRPEHPNASA